MSATALQRLTDLRGVTALVTGASSGLGLHFSRTLAQAGAEVVLAGRRKATLGAPMHEIQAQGGQAHAVAMDVRDRDSVRRALDEAAARTGKCLDVVVNNAGVADTKAALDYTDEDWDSIVGTNLGGAWTVAQEAASRMVAAQLPGSIINITSILANRVAGGVSPYCAAKAGLRHLTQALAVELARYRIRVNSLAPGYIVTDLNRDFLEGEKGGQLRMRNPMRRFGTLADLDGPLLLLASPASAYMTGAELVVDGGHQCNSL